MTLAPPLVPAADLVAALRGPGHSVVDADQWCPAWGMSLPTLQALAPTWHDLPPDNYLRDGGRYRRRRHGCWVADAATLTAVPHRPHWQPVEYNALHGGIERHFEPIDPQVAGSAAWRGLLGGLATVASAVAGARPWYIEAHQFRIDTTDGIGRPTPEGAHRDGVDFVAVFLVDRVGVKGGETRVFEADGPAGLRFTLSRPWTLLK